jgi:hypothetical protein
LGVNVEEKIWKFKINFQSLNCGGQFSYDSKWLE